MIGEGADVPTAPRRFSSEPIRDASQIVHYLSMLEYNLAIGYSGLQGKPESVKIWQEQGIDLRPYPGYKFGHKKIIDSKNIIKPLIKGRCNP